jgi:hypothetical protein
MRCNGNIGLVSKLPSLCTWLLEYNWIGMKTLTLRLWLSITSTLVMIRCMTICLFNTMLVYIGNIFKVNSTPYLQNTLCSQMVVHHSSDVEVIILCFTLPITNQVWRIACLNMHAMELFWQWTWKWKVGWSCSFYKTSFKCWIG